MEPDLDWYIDNVVVPSGPDLARVGPVRTAQAAWLRAARTLRGTGSDLAPVVALALTQGFVLTRAQLRDLGVPACASRRLVRRNQWSVPRFGVVSVLPQAETAPSGTADEVRAAAAALLWRPTTAVSHASAAAMHGLPLLKPPGPPTLTARHMHRACSRQDIRVHIATIWADEIEYWYGTPVMTTARTIVDLARARGVRDGLVAADAALHEQLTTERELERALERQRGWPGARAARRAVELADPRAESPLESLVRLCLIDGGLSAPDLQVWVYTAAGSYRVDMLYDEHKVIIEADGLLKYRDGPLALTREKRRQVHLERAGYRVVRVLWDDVLNHPADTVARVRAELALAALTQPA